MGFQHQRTTCWKLTTASMEKLFYEREANICLTFITLSLVIAFFLAIGFRKGAMTISFALPIDLYNSFFFRECLVHNDFILKDTELLV